MDARVFITALAITAALVGSRPIHAQQCSEILSNGIWENYENVTAQDTRRAFFEWQRQNRMFLGASDFRSFGKGEVAILPAGILAGVGVDIERSEVEQSVHPRPTRR